MTSDVKGYVVRGDYRNGACAWVCLGPSGEHLASTRLAERSLFPVLKDAIRAQADVWVIFDDVSIFRVHADEREERLPDLAEALAHLEAVHEALAVSPGETATGAARRVAAELDQARSEIERLRAVESINVNKIEASLTRLGETVGAIGRMPEHDPRCLVHDGVGCSFEAGCEPARALMASKPTVADGEEWECAKCHTRYGDEHEGWCSRKAQAETADPLAALEAAERRLLEAGGWVRIHGDPDKWTWPPTGVSMARDQAMIFARARAIREQVAKEET